MGLWGSIKRVARSKVVRLAAGAVRTAAKATPMGALADRVLVAGKQLGATVRANQLAKRQGRATTAALTALANTKRPSIVQTSSGKDNPLWIKQATSPDLQPAQAMPVKYKNKNKPTGKAMERWKKRFPNTDPNTVNWDYPLDTAEEEAEYKALLRGGGGSKRKRKSTRTSKARTTPAKSAKQRRDRPQRHAVKGAKVRKLPPALQARADHMKRLAEKWRAAGKPGKWIDYVKAHPK
jgi:hypothetical protein